MEFRANFMKAGSVVVAAMAKLFGTNGIRGIPGKDLTDELVIKVGTAVGRRLGRDIVVGCDGRLSSPRLSRLITSAINSAGSDVHYVGLAPTPAIQLYAGSGKHTGGVVITASHNPPEFNGIKVMGPNGVEIPRAMETEIETMVDSTAAVGHGPEGRLYEEKGVVDLYIRSIREKVDAAIHQGQGLHDSGRRRQRGPVRLGPGAL